MMNQLNIELPPLPATRKSPCLSKAIEYKDESTTGTDRRNDASFDERKCNIPSFVTTANDLLEGSNAILFAGFDPVEAEAASDTFRTSHNLTTPSASQEAKYSP